MDFIWLKEVHALVSGLHALVSGLELFATEDRSCLSIAQKQEGLFPGPWQKTERLLYMLEGVGKPTRESHLIFGGCLNST